jgi:hypothetical protein
MAFYLQVQNVTRRVQRWNLNHRVQRIFNIIYSAAGVAQSVYYLTTDWSTVIRSLAEAKDFSSSVCIQISSEAHPSSYPMGTGGPIPGVKRGRGVTLTTHPHLVPRS